MASNRLATQYELVSFKKNCAKYFNQFYRAACKPHNNTTKRFTLNVKTATEFQRPDIDKAAVNTCI